MFPRLMLHPDVRSPVDIQFGEPLAAQGHLWSASQGSLHSGYGKGIEV